MKRIKLFTVTAVLALVLAAFAAASAFANYDSSAEVTELSGTQTVANTLTTNQGTIKCEIARFSGTEIGTEVEPGIFASPTITVHPTYEKCRAFGLAATTTTTGCNFVFGESTGGAEPTATLSIECEPGRKIVRNAGFGYCVQEFGSQGPLQGVSFTNNPGGTVTARFEVSEIRYTTSGLCGAEEAANGTYTGSVLFEGLNGASIWVG